MGCETGGSDQTAHDFQQAAWMTVFLVSIVPILNAPALALVLLVLEREVHQVESPSVGDTVATPEPSRHGKKEVDAMKPA